MTLQIRPARREDAARIHALIVELADYEKAVHEVLANPAQIEATLFAPDTPTRALVAEHEGVVVGYAVYFYSYSTWLGRNGIYLEDLYVSPIARGTGLGKGLLRELAREAVTNDCGRLEWSVLDWNTPAIDFYESLGAKAQGEWVRYRLDGAALRDFAESGR